MSFLSISEIKNQCAIDEDMQADTDHLERLANAAKIAVENRINRTLYEDEAVLAAQIADDSAPENALLFNDGIKQAMLLFVGEMYANREITVTGASIAKNEFMLECLIDPYKYHTEV